MVAYHQQSNGLVECFQNHLKAALRACLSGPSWTKDLPWMFLGIRTAPKEDLGCSSAELVYGQSLTVPGNFISRCDRPASRNSELLYWCEQASTLMPISPPNTGSNVQLSHHTSARPSLFSSYAMATRLIFNGPKRAPSG